MDVFDLFDLTDYTFLEIKRGTTSGNKIVSSIPAHGVFKLRSGMTVAADQETKSSDATLHIMPSESFVSTGLVGHGVSVLGRQYEIVGSTGGMNFENGDMEHYRVTLQETQFVS